MNKVKKILMIALAGTMIFASACSGSKDTSSEIKPAAKAAKDVVETTGTVTCADVKNIVIDMPLGAQAKLEKLLVKDGQKVKKGERLAELDLTDFNTLITQKTNTIEADKLLKNDMLTKNQKDAQNNKIAAEEAELNSLKGKLNKSYISGNSIVCDIDNGVVFETGYKSGDIIGAAQKLFSIMDLNTIYIAANIDEEFIKDVKEGSSALIIPRYDPTIKLNGKVTKILSQAIKQNGETTIPVEISVEGREKLLPNYTVDIEIAKN